MPRIVEYFGQSLKAALSRKINNGDFRKSRLCPSTNFEVRIQCVSCSSTTFSQLFETQLQRIVIFTYPGLHFLFALGTPLRQSRKTLHERKDNSVHAKPLAACTHLYSTVSQLFELQVQKIAVFTYAAHIFVSPGDAPAIFTQYVAWMERQFNACQTPRITYLSIFNSFRVIRCLSQCANPKNRYFTTFLFPLGNTPVAITLNVVWMEREFDAYKLTRCMCPSN